MAGAFASSRLHALPLVAAAALLLISSCAVSWYSSSPADATELDQLWQPHVGKLTEMVRSSRTSGEARQQSLAEVHPESEMHRGRNGHYASSWAERMLKMGDSKSSAELSDKPARSIVTRGYANTHPHYTSDVRETAASGESDAYDFANTLSRGRNAREMRQQGSAREQELADVPSSMRGPETSAVREDRAEHDTRAWSFASGMHKPSLAQQRRSVGGPKTSAVREVKSGAEQSAWDWASNFFSRSHHHHHHQQPHEEEAPKHVAAPKAAPPAQKKAAAPKVEVEKPVAKVVPAQIDVKHHPALHAARAKSERARKVEAVRRLREDLHSSTLRLEHDTFAKKRQQEQQRVREIAAREAAAEKAADEGAAAEFREYGDIASGGVPNGGSSELSETRAGDGYSDMQSVSRAKRQERAEARVTAKKVAAVALEARQLAKAEEQGYQKGYLAGVEAEKTQDSEDRREYRAGAAERAAKRDKAEKVREEKEARTQNLRDDTNDDADGDFQVDGGQWGPAAGDWA